MSASTQNSINVYDTTEFYTVKSSTTVTHNNGPKLAYSPPLTVIAFVAISVCGTNPNFDSDGLSGGGLS